MNDDIKDKRVVTFTMQDEDSWRTFSREYEDCDPWTYILQDFIQFMEGSGFVGISKKVSVEHSIFTDVRWYGPIHDAPEE
jgi:hypothetical protein